MGRVHSVGMEGSGMTTHIQIQRLAEQDSLTYEEAEDILFDAAEAENDRRRDDALTESTYGKTISETASN